MPNAGESALAEAIAGEIRHVVGGVEEYFREKYGIRVGIAFFLFRFTGDVADDSHTSYGSNASREDMIKAVKEWLDRQEVGLVSDPPGPRAQS